MATSEFALEPGPGPLGAGATPPALSRYLRARASIYYNSNYSDTGVITYIDDSWVEVTKDNGERLLAPTFNIRVIKLLEPGRDEGESGTLLRAASAAGRKQEE